MKFSNAVEALIYKLPSGPSRKALFMFYFHRPLDLKNPGSFTEKLNWRIVKDRRPILKWTCDKLAMKEYAEKSQAAKELGLHVPRTLWSGTDIRDLVVAELPEHWVLKPNNRSGQVYFGHGKPDIVALEKVSKSWRHTFEANSLHEWAYSKARPLIVAEELLGAPGSVPSDYKFYTFAGKVELIQVDVDRHTELRRRMYFPDWTTIEAATIKAPLAPVEPAPANLDQMMAIAGELGRPFDFMRVDLYSVDGDIFFGELTPYSGSGLEAMQPDSLDADLGTKWKLPELHG